MLCKNCYLAVMNFKMTYLLNHREGKDARNSNEVNLFAIEAGFPMHVKQQLISSVSLQI